MVEFSAKAGKQSPQGALDDLDERLEAIKDILIGDSLKMLEKQVNGLNNTVDSGNSRLLNIVDELSKEVVELKSDLNRHKAQEGRNRFEEDEEIRNAVHRLDADFNKKLEAQNEKLEKVAGIQHRIEKLEEEAEAVLQKVSKNLEARSQQLEAEMKERMEKQLRQNSEQYEQLNSKNRQVQQKLEEDLQNLQDSLEKRISEQQNTLERSRHAASQEQMARLKQEFINELHSLKADKNHAEEAAKERFSTWQQQLTTKLGEVESRSQSDKQELNNRQEKFESSVGDILESVAQKVSEKLQHEQEARQELAAEVNRLKGLFMEGNQILASEQERVNGRLNKVEQQTGAIKEVLDEKILKHFDEMSQQRHLLDDKLSTMQQEFSRQIHEANLRLETRMETMLEMNQRHLQQLADQSAGKKTRKDELKETLKRLTDLLDD